jgi:hypothetical protein
MQVFERSVTIDGVTGAQIAAWHARIAAFERLLPPFERVTDVRLPDGLDLGAEVAFRQRVGPVSLGWASAIVSRDGEHGFVDEARRGPFASWRHEHRFEADGVLTDRVAWSLPFGRVSEAALGWWVRSRIERLFGFRHARTRADLRRLLLAPRPLRVGVTGASGLVGTELSQFLRAGGHEVVPFRRRPGEGGIFWSDDGTVPDAEQLVGLDAVVHLAGESVAQRWTDTARARIRDSRVLGTRTLVEAFARCSRPPPVLVSASAVGVYGHREERVDEASAPGTGFLADVGRAWEAEALRAEGSGARVVILRIGTVLSGRGGALPAMLPAFKMGLGGPMGHGRQGMPWVDVDDLVDMAFSAICTPSWRGVYNAVTGPPIDQATFARGLGAALGRPAFVPAPAWAMRAVMGEMAQRLLLEGALVEPARLREAGFNWRFPTLASALAHELGAEAEE